MTATGEENLGDELITLQEIIALRKKFPQDTIIVFSHNIWRTKRFLLTHTSWERLQFLPYFPTNIRHHPLKNIYFLWKNFVAFLQAKHIFIGGGGLLYSSQEERRSPLRLWWFRSWMARLTHTPITYLSLGITAKITELQKMSYGLFHNRTITVRDQESQKRIESLGYQADISHDPVLDFIPTKNAHTKEKITLWWSLRAGFIADGVIIEVIRRCIRNGYEILLLPFSLHPEDWAWHDGRYMEKFLLPGVTTTQSIEQTLSYFAHCDVIVWMRLHSIILSHVYHIPCIAVAYSEKVENMCQQLWETYLNPRHLTADLLYHAIIKHIS